MALVKKKGILGVDPGLDGGFVLLSEDRVVIDRWVVPTLESVKWKVSKKGKKKGEKVKSVSRSLDLVALRRIFIELQPKTTQAVLELVASRPGMSAPAVFKFGHVYGLIEGLLTAFQIPYIQVTPAKWNSIIHAGISKELEPKDRSRIALNRLFPDVDLRVRGERGQLLSKPHEGLMDALLLAEWARRFYDPSQPVKGVVSAGFTAEEADDDDVSNQGAMT